ADPTNIHVYIGGQSQKSILKGVSKEGASAINKDCTNGTRRYNPSEGTIQNHAGSSPAAAADLAQVEDHPKDSKTSGKKNVNAWD
ncbi:hypothetical protein Tco_0614172, partial [Tanacetum coccineum]